jgi:hypothetical protein
MLIKSMPPDGEPYEGITLRLFDLPALASERAGADLAVATPGFNGFRRTPPARRSGPR